MPAGRKPLPLGQRRVPLTVFIAPETNNYLRKAAIEREVSLGKLIDMAVVSLLKNFIDMEESSERFLSKEQD